MLLTLCTLANAADLKLSLSVPDRAPIDVTLHDVAPGRVFTLSAPGFADRIDLDVVQDSSGNLGLTVEGTQVRKGCFGRVRETPVWRSVLALEPDSVATSSVTRPTPVSGGHPVAFRELQFDIEARIEASASAP